MTDSFKKRYKGRVTYVCFEVGMFESLFDCQPGLGVKCLPKQNEQTHKCIFGSSTDQSFSEEIDCLRRGVGEDGRERPSPPEWE